MTSPGLLILLALLAACSHDTERANPLDAALTPAVGLHADLDRTAQTAALTWARYGGDNFDHYLVLRQISDRVAVDTLARFSDLTDTTYTDTTLDPGTDYLYHVSVVNSAGLEASSEVQRIAAFDLPVVSITSLTLEAQSATASLVWSRYGGPDFEAYSVVRSAGSESQLIATLTHIDSTQWLDSGLRGSTEYAYTVTVATQRGHSSVSEAVAGEIHAMVASWPLVDADRRLSQDVHPQWRSEDVRVQWRDGALEVLLFGSELNLYRYDADGVLLDREELLAAAMWDLQRGMVAAAAPVTADGTRLLPWGGRQYGGVLLHRQGALVESQQQLSFDADPENEISGWVQLMSGDRAAHYRSVVTVDTEGLETLADFSSMPELVTRADTRGFAELVGGWAFTDIGTHARELDWISLTSSGSSTGWGSAQQVPNTSPSVRVSAQVIARPSAEVHLGVGGPSQLALRVAGPSLELGDIGEASLVWTRPGRSDTVHAPFPVFGYPVDISMQTVNAAPQASITYPVLLGQASYGSRMSLAGIDQHSAWTAGNRAMAIDADGTITALGELSGAPADIRSWQLEGESRPRIAVCLPDEDQVLFGSVFRGSRWTDALRGGTIGLRIGAGGTLYYPLSVAAGPGGRMYVLDAGHGRIVVFDQDGGYITEFGAPGSGEGEFDFGSGNSVASGLDLKGSLAVDDDGFIYVADMGNGRIQKFGP